ncbi:MAG: tetratricopeptide repeat protein, partial [Gammaproteobacteria bacterium]|nr:tetratricopeptide repeat protein [Gammaproteobacteria bacterium]
AALQRLLDFSLADTDYAPDIQVRQYRISPLAAEWLAAQGGKIELRHYQAAADYQLWQFKYLRPTIQQAMIVHQALQNANQRETARAFALDNLAGYFHNAGLYRTLLLEWLPDLRESEEPVRRAEALIRTGTAYHALGEYDAALEYFTKSLAIQQEIGNKSGEGATLNNISQIFQARGDYDTALDYLKESITIQKDIGDKSGEGTTLNNICTIYHMRGDYDTALDYSKKSLAIQQEIGDKSGEGKTLNNISLIFQARGDYDTALDYLKKSLAIQQEIGDKSGEGKTLNNISQIFKA